MSTVKRTRPSTNTADSGLVYLTPEQASQIASQYQTPCYVYSEDILRNRAKQALATPVPYGLTVRYAMKANPLAAILRIFDDSGIHIDASSGPEVERALRVGIPGDHIMLTCSRSPRT
jgi:diaminopimelate decarboxylase